MARAAVGDGDLVLSIDMCLCDGLASVTTATRTAATTAATRAATTGARGRVEAGEGWAGVVGCRVGIRVV